MEGQAGEEVGWREMLPQAKPSSIGELRPKGLPHACGWPLSGCAGVRVKPL